METIIVIDLLGSIAGRISSFCLASILVAHKNPSIRLIERIRDKIRIE